MASKHKLSEKKRAIIPTEYEAGASTTELANRYGVSSRTIRNILSSAGVPTRSVGQPFKLTPADDAVIAAAYAGGASSAELAVRFGVYRTTIRRAVRRAGTPLREPGPKRQHVKDAVRDKRNQREIR